jgi:hypothetical protein
VLVSADHGHTARGGHGGTEADVVTVPLVVAGPGLRAGAVTAGRQIDVAPTLAALLGVAVPARSLGRPLLELMANPQPLAQVEAAEARRRHILENHLAQHAMNQRLRDARRRPGRMLAAAVLALGLAVLLWRLGSTLADLVAALAYLGVWAAAQWWLVGPPSLSTLRNLGSVLALYLVCGPVAFAAVAATAKRRVRRAPGVHVVTTVVVAALPWLVAGLLHGFRGGPLPPSPQAVGWAMFGVVPLVSALLSGAVVLALSGAGTGK